MHALALARSTREYIDGHLRFGDGKAASIIGFAATILAAVIVGLRDIVSAHSDSHGLACFLAVCAALPSCGCGASTVWHALAALTPNTSPAFQSFASFADLAQQSLESYEARLASPTESDVAVEYAKHNIALSRIALAKFDAISRSIRWLKGLLMTSIVFGLFYVGLWAALLHPANR